MKRKQIVQRDNTVFIVVAIAVLVASFIYGYIHKSAAPDQLEGTASVQSPARSEQPEGEGTDAPAPQAPASARCSR